MRNNLALAMPDILKEHPGYTNAQLGTALTGLSIAYGASKFLMGSVSDRSNPRWFLPLGLLLSCLITFLCGSVRALYGSLASVILLQTLNGWVQGMGWPPCGKIIVHWFSTRERGLVVSLWNVAHNVGGALVATLAAFAFTVFHDWGAKFYFNALVASAAAAGFTGFFGYVFGSAISGTGVGWIADRWSWRGVFITMVVCCVLTVACCAFTLSHKADSANRR